MKRTNVFLLSLFSLLLSVTAWADGTTELTPVEVTDSRLFYPSTSTDNPEFLYKIHCGAQNQTGYWGNKGNWVEAASAAEFAFIKKENTDNQYYIYCKTDDTYVSCSASALANGIDKATSVSTQTEANAWEITVCTNGGTRYLQMRPLTSAGTPANFYANWYGGTSNTHSSMGLYQNSGSADAGSTWTVVLSSEITTTHTVTYNVTLQGGSSAFCALQIKNVPDGVAYPTPLALPSSVATTSSEYYSWTDIPEGNVTADVTNNVTLVQNPPFTVSTSYEDAKWYTMSITASKNILNYEEGSNKIYLNRTTTDYNPKDLFCFVGDIINGFKIYNMEAGSGKLLSSGSNPYDGKTGGITYVSLTDEATATSSGHVYLWDLTKSTSTNSNLSGGFFLGMHGTAAGRMNSRNEDQSASNYLAFWVGGAGDGSTFMINSADDAIETAASNAQKLVSTIGTTGFPGEDDVVATNLSTSVSAYNSAKTSSTKKDVLNAFSAYKTAIMPTAGKFYTFQCASTEGYYVLSTLSSKYSESGKTRLATAAASDDNAADRIFYFDGSSMMGYNNGYFLIKNSDGSGFLTQGTVGAESGTNFTFAIADYSKGTQCVNFENGTRGMYAKDNGFVNAGSANTTSDGYTFNVAEVTSLPLTIGSNGWSSFSAPVDVCVPTESGVKVYYAKDKPADGKLVLTELTTGVIPANTGVLVQGTEKEIVHFSTNVASEATALTDNLLVSNWYVKSVGEADNTTDGKYAFATKTSDDNTKTTGFMKLLTPITLLGHKCWLQTSTSAASAQFVPIALADDPTGIESAETTTVSGSDAPVYDLQGRKVNGTKKGGMYIQNGKVFIAM
jgi:hypothetical protein